MGKCCFDLFRLFHSLLRCTTRCSFIPTFVCLIRKLSPFHSPACQTAYLCWCHENLLPYKIYLWLSSSPKRSPALYEMGETLGLILNISKCSVMTFCRNEILIKHSYFVNNCAGDGCTRKAGHECACVWMRARTAANTQPVLCGDTYTYRFDNSMGGNKSGLYLKNQRQREGIGADCK